MKKKIINVTFWGVLIFYLLLLFEVLIWRGGQGYRTGINLIPFRSIAEGINHFDGIRYHLVDMQVWGNVLMFIPAGIYLMLLRTKRSMPKTFLTIFIFSLTVEIIQFIFGLGASDIDDVILNSLGGVIGIIIYHFMVKIFKTKERARNAIAYTSIFVGLSLFVLIIILFIANP